MDNKMYHIYRNKTMIYPKRGKGQVCEAVIYKLNIKYRVPANNWLLVKIRKLISAQCKRIRYTSGRLIMIIAVWLLLSLYGQCRDYDKLMNRIRAAYQRRSTNVIVLY